MSCSAMSNVNIFGGLEPSDYKESIKECKREINDYIDEIIAETKNRSVDILVQMKKDDDWHLTKEEWDYVIENFRKMVFKKR